MWKSNIPQRGASSGPWKHEAWGQVLSRFWWCTELRNVWFPQGHGILLLSHDHQRKYAEIAHTSFLHELCLGHGITLIWHRKAYWMGEVSPTSPGHTAAWRFTSCQNIMESLFCCFVPWNVYFLPPALHSTFVIISGGYTWSISEGSVAKDHDTRYGCYGACHKVGLLYRLSRDRLSIISRNSEGQMNPSTHRTGRHIIQAFISC